MSLKKNLIILGTSGIISYVTNGFAQDRPLDPAGVLGDNVQEYVLNDSPSFVSRGLENNPLLGIRQIDGKDYVCLKGADDGEFSSVHVESSRYPQFDGNYSADRLALRLVDRDAGERDVEFPLLFDARGCTIIPESMQDGDGYFYATLHTQPSQNSDGQMETARIAEALRAPLSEISMSGGNPQSGGAAAANARGGDQSQGEVLDDIEEQSPVVGSQPSAVIIPPQRFGVGVGFPRDQSRESQSRGRPYQSFDLSGSQSRDFERSSYADLGNNFYGNLSLSADLSGLDAEARTRMSGHALALMANAGLRDEDNLWAAGLSGRVYGRDQSVGSPSTGLPLGDNEFSYRTIGVTGRIGSPEGANLVLLAEYLNQDIDFDFAGMNFTERSVGGVFGARLAVPRILSNGNGNFSVGLIGSGHFEALTDIMQRNHPGNFSVDYGLKTRSLFEAGIMAQRDSDFAATFDASLRREDNYSIVPKPNLPLETLMRLQRQQEEGVVQFGYATRSNNTGYGISAGSRFDVSGVEFSGRLIVPVFGSVRRTSAEVGASYGAFSGAVNCGVVSVPGNGSRVSDESCSITAGLHFGDGPRPVLRPRYPMR